jgi:N-acetylglutamate synthase-like GNAT family acetyltransferase
VNAAAAADASVRLVSSVEPDPASPATVVRAATEADAKAIHDLVHDAQLNPRDLDWRRFLVADEDGTVVACAQVRVHGSGTRELASVVVLPDRRARGVGRTVVEAAIARERVRPLYLYCESRTVAFWERFAFRPIEGEDIPRDMRATFRMGRIAVRAMSLATHRHYALYVMRRDDP